MSRDCTNITEIRFLWIGLYKVDGFSRKNNLPKNGHCRVWMGNRSKVQNVSKLCGTGALRDSLRGRRSNFSALQVGTYFASNWNLWRVSYCAVSGSSEVKQAASNRSKSQEICRSNLHHNRATTLLPSTSHCSSVINRNPVSELLCNQTPLQLLDRFSYCI